MVTPDGTITVTSETVTESNSNRAVTVAECMWVVRRVLSCYFRGVYSNRR